MKQEHSHQNDNSRENETEFHPSFLGRLIDNIIFVNKGLPVELRFEMKKDLQRNERLRSGKVNDPIEREKLERESLVFSKKFQNYLEKKYPDKDPKSD